MNLKLLACDVLTREVGHCLVRSPHMISVTFSAKGDHDDASRLRAIIQSNIDAVASEDVAYDAILLAYGLCGNSTVGLVARDLPLIVPRAHDCTTLFLGSKEAFEEHFGANPSQVWASVGYSERGESMISDTSTHGFLGLDQDYAAMVATYGEENAKYLLDTLRTQHGSDQLFLIDVPETRVEAVFTRIREQAAVLNLTVRTIPGSVALIDKLVSGDWPDSDFLTVPPGHRIAGVYDLEQVIEAVPAG